MAFFKIPGWDTGPIAESSLSPSSKKRKRASLDSSDSRLKSAEANLDKLVQKFRGSTSSESSPPKPSQTSPKSNAVLKNALSKHAERKKEKKAQALEEKKKTISHPKALKPTNPAAKIQSQRPKSRQRQSSEISTVTTASVNPPPPKKKLKTEHETSQKSVKFASDIPDTSRGLTELQKGMKQSLSGARFRFVLSKSSA
jgi:ribosomal RNA-processing protein 8